MKRIARAVQIQMQQWTVGRAEAVCIEKVLVHRRCCAFGVLRHEEECQNDVWQAFGSEDVVEYNLVMARDASSELRSKSLGQI